MNKVEHYAGWLLAILLLLLVTMVACDNRSEGSVTTDSETFPEPIVTLDETLVSVASPEDATIQADFGRSSGLPIFRKVSGFTSGWIDKNLIVNSIEPLSQMRGDNYRLDMVASTNGIWETYGQASFTVLHTLTKAMLEQDILPYICMMPLPNALKPEGSETNNTAPTDYDGYYEYVYDVAEAIRGRKTAKPIYEIWNEPDLAFFFDREYSEYVKMYSYASRAVRDADPDAVVGGLSAGDLISLDSERDGARMFLNSVVENDLPLDFVSYHCYNEVSGWGQDPVRYSARMRNILNEYELPAVQMHMTEYNIAQGDKTLRYDAPAKALTSLMLMNDITELQVISWASTCEPGDLHGFLQPNTFEPYPSYHMLKFFQSMPYTRRQVTNASKLSTVASSDDHRAAMILWNMKNDTMTETISFGNLPFSHGKVTVYIINEEHALFESGKSEFYVAMEADYVELADFGVTVTLDYGDSCYIEITDYSGIDETAPVEAIGTYIRKDYYFTDRGEDCYAEFERRSQTLLMGMGDTTDTRAATSVVYDNVDDAITVLTSFDCQNDVLTGACGMQIAYHTADGYTKAVYYPIAGTAELFFNWADTTDTAEVLPESLTISLKDQAPEGFDGRIRISFVIEDMPAWSAAKVQIRSAA